MCATIHRRNTLGLEGRQIFQLYRILVRQKLALNSISHPTQNIEKLTRNYFKDDIEDREGSRIRLELTSFDDHNQKDSQNKQPDIMSQLCPQLLLHEHAFVVASSSTKSFLSPRHEGLSFCLQLFVLDFVRRIYTKTSFFVHVGIAYGDCNRERRYIHHDDIQDLQGDSHCWDGNDVKPAGTDRCCLKEAIDELNAWRVSSNLRVADLEDLGTK